MGSENMKSHKDLDVWKAAIRLAREIYAVTATFPREEQFGMTTQMRRASVSIASNIAEGAARQGDKEFVHFLHMSLGSAAELETQLTIAREVGLGSPTTLDPVDVSVVRVRQLLIGLVRSIKAS
jgi:four helix bundle protein